MLKTLALGITFIIVVGIGAYVWARSTRPLLVLDMQNMAEFPSRFRTSSDLITNDQINTKGLSSLRMMGSGQFSEVSLRFILHHFNIQRLTIIDLRQESHGFLNGDAISWYAAHNAANRKKSDKQIEKIQERLLTNLKQLSRVNIYKILEKAEDATIKHSKPILYNVQDVKSEAEVSAEHHFDYQRVYVQDFHAPDSFQVDRFIQIVKRLPPGEWIYFHCRGGVGRTTVFMAMYDMMHNAKRISFDDVLARETTIGGKDLTDLPTKGSYKYSFGLERINFLRKFYDYARHNHDEFATSWRDWLKRS